MSVEEWRDIPGYEGNYQISNTTQVKSLPKIVMRKNGSPLTIKGSVLGLSRRDDGYLVVWLFGSGKKGRSYLVHRLLALAFIPNPDGKEEVNHKDGNKWNNTLSNLEWVTHAENMKHASINGLTGGLPRPGSSNPSATLDENEVRVIRKRYVQEKITQRELAELFGVNQVTISDIIIRKTWTHI